MTPDRTDLADDQIEDRVRRTLRAVADATSLDDAAEPAYAAGARRPRPRWLGPLAAAAAVVVVIAAGVVVVRAIDDGGVTVGTPAQTLPPPSTPAPPQPSDRPGLSDGPIFMGPGDASQVFNAYRESRLPDVSTSVVAGDGVATATWSFEDDSGVVARGTVHLAYLSDQWAVVEAETDGVTVEGLRLENGTLKATISTTNVNSFVAEVLDVGGNPLRGSERIGPTQGPLDLDVTIGEQPVIVRVQLIGGTMLSVTELRVDPLVRHGGEDAGRGAWAGGTWQLLHDGDCRWIALNGVPHRPTCGSDGTATFTQFGPVSRTADQTLWFGIVGPQVAVVRFDLGDGNTLDFPPSSPAFAAAVPRTATAVTFHDDAGNELDRLEIDPAGALGG